MRGKRICPVGRGADRHSCARWHAGPAVNRGRRAWGRRNATAGAHRSPLLPSSAVRGSSASARAHGWPACALRDRLSPCQPREGVPRTFQARRRFGNGPPGLVHALADHFARARGIQHRTHALAPGAAGHPSSSHPCELTASGYPRPRRGRPTGRHAGSSRRARYTPLRAPPRRIRADVWCICHPARRRSVERERRMAGAWSRPWREPAPCVPSLQ